MAETEKYAHVTYSEWRYEQPNREVIMRSSRRHYDLRPEIKSAPHWRPRR
jgi:bisphosphoglycerate-independent phosphoglycerate mutase (AlkP superfamily)